MAVNCDDFYKDPEGQWWQNVPPLRRIRPEQVPPQCRGAGATTLAQTARVKLPEWVKLIPAAKKKLAVKQKAAAGKKTPVQRGAKKKAAKRDAKKKRRAS
jgi:hypothetical protein